MRELSLHILDLAENSVSAGADKVRILVHEDMHADRLIIAVQDNGRGMDEASLAQVCDPFFTSRTTRKVGLGIPFLKAAAESCQGIFIIESTPGKGTHVKAEFKHSHIDRMPLGDLAGTLLTLLVSFPDTHWIF
ncbi:MAG: sensor histidine kinase, partial [Anaerolineales bacterium]|nr:sensor histidine kinase [Anaerolineales bacterium]